MATTTKTENGADALTVAGVAKPLMDQGERGGAIAALGGSLVGPRGVQLIPLGSTKTAKIVGKTPRPNKAVTGISRGVLASLIDAIVTEGVDTHDSANQLADLVVLMFNVLDVIDGRGERALFVWMYLAIYSKLPALRPALLALIPSVPHYGCWRTLASLHAQSQTDDKAAAAAAPVAGATAAVAALSVADAASTSGTASAAPAGASAPTPNQVLRTTIVNLWAARLAADAKRLEECTAAGMPATRLSLAAKWAPSLDSAAERVTGIGSAIMARLAVIAPSLLNPRLAPVPTAAAAAATAAPAAAAPAGAAAAAAAGGASAAPAAAAAAAADGEDAETEVEDDAAASAADAAAAAAAGPAAVPLSKKAYRAHAMQYRKLLTRLRAALDPVEVKMAGGRMADIDPTRVSSLANRKYRAALQNEVGSLVAHERFPVEGRDKGKRAGLRLPRTLDEAVAMFGVEGVRAAPGWKGQAAPLADADLAAKGQAAAAAAAADAGKRARITNLSAKAARSMAPDRVACAEHVAAAIQRSIDAAKERAAAVAAGGPAAGAALAKGAQADKVIKGRRNQVHELVEAYMEPSAEKDDMIEALWADVVTQLRTAGKWAPSVSIVDVSGSMSGTPMVVAIALGILLAQLQPEGSPYKNKMITFHEKPSWIDISGCTNLFEAVRHVMAADWGCSTKFSLAMQMVLRTALDNKAQADVIPANLFVFSDMQFCSALRVSPPAGVNADFGTGTSQEAIFNLNEGGDIREAWRAAGLTPPTIVYWNLRSSVLGFQADAGTPGIALMSGFSQECLKDFCESGGDLASVAPSAEEAVAAGAAAAAEAKRKADQAAWAKLAKTLAKPRYSRVRKVLADKLEGYTLPVKPAAEEPAAAGAATGAAGAASGGAGAAAAVGGAGTA